MRELIPYMGNLYSLTYLLVTIHLLGEINCFPSFRFSVRHLLLKGFELPIPQGHPFLLERKLNWVRLAIQSSWEPILIQIYITSTTCLFLMLV